MQPIEILKWLQPITGHCRYLFPSLRTPTRPISDNALNAALRRLDDLRAGSNVVPPKISA
jgi:hypothetical protein